MALLKSDPAMTSKKLYTVLEILKRNLSEKRIPFALIGGFALGAYGMPRYTADIDLLCHVKHGADISRMMAGLGYHCVQKTDSFAQFNSDFGVLGKIDFMFVATADGEKILRESILVDDELLGTTPVVQPTDYVILKLMAIANNPERSAKDEADIATFFQLSHGDLLPEGFKPLDGEKILLFAERFRKRDLIERYMERYMGGSPGVNGNSGEFGL